MNAQLKAAVASYARSFIVAAMTLYLAGTTDPKAIVLAGVAAIAGPLLRAINPKDTSFGKKTI